MSVGTITLRDLRTICDIEFGAHEAKKGPYCLWHSPKIDRIS